MGQISESTTTREAGGLNILAGGKCRWQEKTEARLCFDVALAPGASHPVWARIFRTAGAGFSGIRI
jgi:hypothetical protein